MCIECVWEEGIVVRPKMERIRFSEVLYKTSRLGGRRLEWNAIERENILIHILAEEGNGGGYVA